MHSLKITQFLLLLSCVVAVQAQKSYYLSNSGSDDSEGSQAKPWKTITRLNHQQLVPGDRVYFNGGDVFEGTIQLDSTERGTAARPIELNAYGRGPAHIKSGAAEGLRLTNTRFIALKNLAFHGLGRKEGNTSQGVNIAYSKYITARNLDIQGYQKAGLLFYCSSYCRADAVYAHDNGAAGILVSGEKDKSDCYDIKLTFCRAENNPGDPTQLENHSGNGILVGLCRKVVVSNCVATNNGWDMPRIGNGPVGIWAYEADSVIIEHCISYRNKTSVGGEDGGGFDLDGGITNSIIQYCLSYENQGGAFGIFQYAGASNWYNNIIRFNISENDGEVSTAHAGVYVWNSSNDAKQFNKCYFYNNIIYNSRGAAIRYATESTHSEFFFLNNIFVGHDSLLKGNYDSSQFYGNNWWSMVGEFRVDEFASLDSWARAKKKEWRNDQVTGFQIEPDFHHPGKTNITKADSLAHFDNYRYNKVPAFLYKGVDVEKLAGMKTLQKDFLGNRIGKGFVGAVR